MANESTPRECNILFLGESQSGKSTLIEFLQRYADPGYTINKDHVGDGIFSCTKDVRITTIHTDLPSTFVLNKKTGERVDYGKFLEEDQEDYEDELNDRKTYQTGTERLTTEQVIFNLYDTPGLNDTDLTDEDNIAVIFKALEKEKVPSINLIIITVANNPFTEDLQSALKTYVNLLPDLNGNIVFVHTRIDYSKLHPKEELFVITLQEKKRILHDLMKRETVPHLLIDNDILSTRTIRNCMTQNKLRELLAMAKLNQPVSLQVMVINKTEKMRIVDEILKDKFTVIVATREETLAHKHKEQKAVLETLGEIKGEIVKYQTDLQNIARDIAFHDREALHLLHEERYDQTWSMMKLGVAKTAMYYPGKTLERKPGFVNHVLDHVDKQAHNIKVLQEAGGVGENHWAVKFHRKRFQDGVYHVKLYIKKSKMFSAKIEELQTKNNTTKGLLLESQELLDKCNQDSKDIQSEIQELIDELESNRNILGRVSTQQVHSKVFQAIVAANVYVREDSVSAIKLEDFYTKKLPLLDAMEKIDDPVYTAPLNTSEETNDTSEETKDECSKAEALADAKLVTEMEGMSFEKASSHEE
ncbi:hypothetical protein CPB97_007794 [Podila verticillata]|nr:hypothetical protein CPB97_007794 [Podila verticillata]